VSLDTWRERLDIAPDETQGKVIRAALDEARVHLRVRQLFVWNATNVTRLTRDRVIDLCLDYDAHVAITRWTRRPTGCWRRTASARPACQSPSSPA
jgi:predicted kinase